MNETLYVSGDFSGIQSYVLGITAEGAGQARRLRARSFTVQVAGEIAVRRILEAFQAREDAALVNGGGQFLLQVPGDGEAEARLEGVRRDLETRMLEEFGGELALTLAWAPDVETALEKKERAKRRPWQAAMAPGGRWNAGRMSRPEIGEPCEICRKRRWTERRRDGERELDLCERCARDIKLGRWAQQTHEIKFNEPGEAIVVLGERLGFRRAGPGDQRLERHVPTEGDELLTFEEIAARSRGDPLLGVLKMDVDNMGVRVAELIAQDRTYARLKEFSIELDRFFSHTIQRWMTERDFWPVYTVYSGGDDLLLAGPWDVMVKFAIRVNDEFRSSLGKHGKHGLTLSAGLAFTKPKIPLRHAVERADELLEKSKKGTKDQCACLDAVLRWDRFVDVAGNGRKIAKWIDDRRGYCPRSLVQRLYRLATGEYQNKAGLWAWQVGRNFPPRWATTDAAEMRQWGLRVLDDVSPGRMQEVGASLLYVLTATRGRREQDDG